MNFVIIQHGRQTDEYCKKKWLCSKVVRAHMHIVRGLLGCDKSNRLHRPLQVTKLHRALVWRCRICNPTTTTTTTTTAHITSIPCENAPTQHHTHMCCLGMYLAFSSHVRTAVTMLGVTLLQLDPHPWTPAVPASSIKWNMRDKLTGGAWHPTRDLMV